MLARPEETPRAQNLRPPLLGRLTRLLRPALRRGSRERMARLRARRQGGCPLRLARRRKPESLTLTEERDLTDDLEQYRISTGVYPGQ